MYSLGLAGLLTSSMPWSKAIGEKLFQWLTSGARHLPLRKLNNWKVGWVVTVAIRIEDKVPHLPLLLVVQRTISLKQRPRQKVWKVIPRQCSNRKLSKLCRRVPVLASKLTSQITTTFQSLLLLIRLKEWRRFWMNLRSMTRNRFSKNSW